MLLNDEMFLLANAVKKYEGDWDEHIPSSWEVETRAVIENVGYVEEVTTDRGNIGGVVVFDDGRLEAQWTYGKALKKLIFEVLYVE